MHSSRRTLVVAKALFLIVCSPALVLITGCGASGNRTSTAASLQTPTTTTSTPTSTPTPTPTPIPTPTPSSPVPHSSHVVLVIEENHQFTQVYPSGMPWLVAQGNVRIRATNYHVDEPGSALDYFWLSSGSGEQAFD